MNHEREEEAFRQGLRDSLEGEAFSPLDPAALKAAAPATAPNRVRWLAAAAVVVVALAGITALNTNWGGSSASVESGTTGIAADEGAQAAQPSTAIDASDPPPAPSPWRDTQPVTFSVEEPLAGAAVGTDFYVARGSAAYRLTGGYSWSELPAPPTEIGATQPVVNGTTVYFIGRDEKSAAAYDTEANSWTQLAIPAGSLVAGGGQLYSVGKRVQRFDAELAQWQALPEDPLPGSGERAAGWAAGGGAVAAQLVLWESDGPGKPVRMAAFDPATQVWKQVPMQDAATGEPIVYGTQLYFAKTRFDLDGWDWAKVVGDLPDSLSGAVPYGEHSLYVDGLVVDPFAGTSEAVSLPVLARSATLVGADTGLLVLGLSKVDSSAGVSYLLEVDG